MNGPNFFGTLVSGNYKNKIAKIKEKSYHEKKIHKALQEEYTEKGWSFYNEQKSNIILRKDKKIDEMLEDQAWVLFSNLDFYEMNLDRKFRITAGPSPKQIDVFAKDEHNVFVIFCTSQQSKGTSNDLKRDIREISAMKDEICQGIYNHYGKIRVSFILLTKNIEWNQTDEQLAEDKNIFFWKEDDLEAYINLVDQLGANAKYQMYAILFAGRKALEVGDIKVPALRGGKGDSKYYCFVISPQRLFPVAYVHRREKTNALDVKNSYQRMVSKYRLNRITEFVNNGNSFCNNIIMSFSSKQKPRFKPHSKVKDIEDISYGILSFPPYYGCAWIIDGQHRLYGYCKSEKATEHTIPVIAFEDLSIPKQANLFVDINKEQASVNTALLWDLYPDIYDQSEKKEHQILKTISLVAKTLNSDPKSIFYNHINIPSLITHDKKRINLTLTNLCDAIKDNRLIEEDKNILYQEDYEKTINYAAKRINAFFEVVNESLPGNWEKGDKGLIRTNVGLRIFFIIFRMLLRYLEHKGEGNIYRKNDLSEFKTKTKSILEPVFSKIKKTDSQKIDDIRSASNKSMVLKNSQMLLWELYDDFQFGAELWKDGKGWSPPIPGEESDGNIKKMIKDTETEVKQFLIKKLKSIHKDQWWENGVTEGAKQNIRKNIENRLKNAAYKRVEVLAYPYEKKILLYLSTSDLKEIIKNEVNWKQLKHIFGDQIYMLAMFKSLENIRNAFIGHEERKEEIDEIEKNLGYWGTKYIRRCIGLDPQKVQ